MCVFVVVVVACVVGNDDGDDGGAAADALTFSDIATSIITALFVDGVLANPPPAIN